MGTTSSRPILEGEEFLENTNTDQQDVDNPTPISDRPETCWGFLLRKVYDVFGFNYQPLPDSPSPGRRKRRLSEENVDVERSSKTPRLSIDGDSRESPHCTQDKEEKIIDTKRDTMKDSVKIIRDEPEETTESAVKTKYMDFPFLTEEKARKYLTQSWTMIILRGLPGSGKSTIARELETTFPGAVTCSADQFFLSESGEYNFDASLLGEAHKWCQARAEETCREGTNILVVDNTNVKKWEMVPYFKIAKMYRYSVLVVQSKTPWNFNIEELEMRNSHGVNRVALSRRLKDWQTVRPLYYGWFLSSLDSYLLLSRARHVLRLALTLPTFLQDLVTWAGSDRVEDILNLYTRDNISSGLTCHSTARFVGKSDEEENPEETDLLGTVSELTVAGFILTPRTFGARLVLSSGQLAVYRQNDTEPFSLPPQHPRQAERRPKETVEPTEPEYGSLEGSLREVEGSRLDMLGGERGRRAHITLGCAGHTRPVQTGLDQLEVLRQLQTTHQRETATFQEGSVTKSGNSGWVISLNSPITVSSLYTGSY